MLRNNSHNFGLVSILLHWIMAVLLTGLFAAGLYMTSLDYYDPWYHSLPWWHKSFGLLTVFLLLVRYIWKLINVDPAPLATHQHWETLLARIIQNAFYLLILLIGISGYLISTSKGKGVAFFDWFEIPAIYGSLDEQSVDLTGMVHAYLAYLLAALVALHALAALKHHFIDKDKTLQRMLGGS